MQFGVQRIEASLEGRTAPFVNAIIEWPCLVLTSEVKRVCMCFILLAAANADSVISSQGRKTSIGLASERYYSERCQNQFFKADDKAFDSRGGKI